MKIRKILFATVVPAQLIFAGTAFAQQPQPAADESASSSEMPGEIIVTARRRSEVLDKVPIAITALSAKDLKERMVTNIDDLKRVTPSLTMSAAQGRRSTPSIGIRGQLVSDTLTSADPSVAFYFDEVVLTPNQGINLGLYDMENVQVLKGPQGTLFGRNTTGGAILLTPAKPTQTLAASVTGHYGNYDEKGLTGFVNVPLTDRLSVRVAGNYLKHDGYSRVIAGPDTGHQLDSENNISGRISFAWDPTDTISNRLTYAYDRGRAGGGANVLRSLNPANTIRFYNGGAPFNLPSIAAALARQQGRSVRELEANSANFENVRSHILVNTTTIELGDVKLKNIFGYRNVNYELSYEGDDSTIGVFGVFNPALNRQYSDEIQLSGEAFQGKTNWIMGIYYFRQRAIEPGNSTSYTGLNANSPTRSYHRINNRSFSGYLQQTSELLPKLSLTTGLRYTVDQRRVRPSNYTSAMAPNPNVCTLRDLNNMPLPITNCTVDLQKSFSDPTWTISLDYKVTPDTLIYLASRRGYRSGGFNARGQSREQYLPFRPETVTDFETGLKTNTNALGFPVHATMATYLQKYHDIQRVVTFLSPFSQSISSSIINAAKATVWGFEAEVSVVPVDPVTISVGYSYVHPKYDSFPTASGDFSDRKFARIPTHQLNASVTGRLIDNDEVGQVRANLAYDYRSGFYVSETFQTGAQVRTQSAVTAALANQIPDKIPGSWVPKVGLFNARLSWDHVMGSNFGAAAYVRNLTNKTYASSGLGLYESLGLIFNNYGDPRTYGLEISYSF